MRQLCLCVAILIVSAFSVAHAENEQILGFYSQVHVNTDASVDVSEQITVYANGGKIIHGIMRQLPLHYKDSYGINQRTDYKVTSVLLNDKPSAYFTKRSNSQLIIYIGSADITLAPGIYVYVINYHVNNVINFLNDADEIYWNVTGNNWIFPIVKARADIILPNSAIIGLYDAYTGIKGSQEKNFDVNKIAPNQIIFQTTQSLVPGQGFSVAVSWQKGIVHKPTWQQLLISNSNSTEVIIFELALLTFVYYLFVWYQYGKDPSKGTIIPLFTPPANLSPAAIRYVMEMGYDIKVFTATIIQMAVKGLLKIDEVDNEISLIKQTVENPSDIAPEEVAIMTSLFKTDVKILLSSTNAIKFKNAIKALKNTLRTRYQGKYFITNYIYLIPGIFLALIACGIAVYSANEPDAAIFMLIWLTLWSSACMGLWYQLFCSFSLISKSITQAASTLGLAVVSLVFLASEVGGLFALANTVPMLTVPLLMLIAVTNYIFSILLKAPTAEGRQLMDQIDGFKLFLSTTERYRLDQMNPPNQTPQLFEKYLPYAIALGVENQWGEQFSESLRLAGQDPANYSPVWYHGHWDHTHPAAFGTFLGASLNSSLALASIPASKGGSGGGGFSGGGRGGGGGGGW